MNPAVWTKKSKFRHALRELTLAEKQTAATRLYNRGRMFDYLLRRFKGLERLLDALRIELRGTKHTWPYRISDQKAYVLEYHAGAVEDLCYRVKEEEAQDMFRSSRRMRRYLLKRYGKRLDKALLQAVRSGRCRIWESE